MASQLTPLFTGTRQPALLSGHSAVVLLLQAQVPAVGLLKTQSHTLQLHSTDGFQINEGSSDL